MKVITNHLWF